MNIPGAIVAILPQIINTIFDVVDSVQNREKNNQDWNQLADSIVASVLELVGSEHQQFVQSYVHGNMHRFLPKADFGGGK